MMPNSVFILSTLWLIHAEISDLKLAILLSLSDRVGLEAELHDANKEVERLAKLHRRSERQVRQ